MISDKDLMEELRTEAVDTVEDRMANLQETIEHFRQGRISADDTLATIKLETHSLKSVAASFEMKVLKAVCHRLEDYIFSLEELTDKVCRDLLVFLDRMSEALEAFVNNRDMDVSALMRRLPAKGGSFDVADVSVVDIEVMLVMEPGTATKIITRELVECGYRMVNVASTLDAIQLIPSMRPDAVIISRVMPELSGLDMACALKAMPATRDIPVALISTSGKESAELKDLPQSVPVLSKGSNFSDDVADVFSKFGIL